jgi:hypothetical protein
MLPGDDMVYLERQTIEFLSDLTILTTTAGTQPNESLQRALHAASASSCLAVRGTAALKRPASLRLHNVQQVADPLIAIDLGFFVWRERAFADLGGELPHAGLVGGVEVEGKEGAGRLWGEGRQVRLKDAAQYGYVACSGVIRLHSDVPPTSQVTC